MWWRQEEQAAGGGGTKYRDAPPRSLLGTEGMNRVRARFPPFLGTWPARAYHLPGLDDEMPYVA